MRRLQPAIILSCIVMLTECTSHAVQQEKIELSQPEADLTDAHRENSAGISGEDDTAAQAAEADKTAEETSEAAPKTGKEAGETPQTDDKVSDPSDSDETADDDKVYLKPCNSYQDILDNVYEAIVADYTTRVVESDDAFTYVGVAETRIGQDADEALASVGYTLYDVDGNGVEELIIVDTGEEGSPWNNRILIMASLLDDKPVEVIGGWARYRFYLLNDNTIYHEGSGGAAYIRFGTCRMAEDGASLEVIDYFFSDYRDDSLEEYQLAEGNWGWFHNTTGEQKKEESEWIEFENEEVPLEMQEAYIGQVKDLDLTFFETLRQ